jgi:hypothetical protein
MTIESLLDCSADKLEAMSDAQLNEVLAPYFNVTRPEFAGKSSGAKSTGVSSKKVSAKTPVDWDKEQKKKAAFAYAAQMGINLKPL